MTTTNDIVEAVAGIIRNLFPEAMVYNRFLAGFENRVCPNELRDATRKVNGWIVTEASETREELHPGLVHRDTVTLRVWGFRQFADGTNEDNSEVWFREDRRRLRDAISARPTLGLDDMVEGHLGLQFASINTYAYTNVLVHVAAGEILVGTVACQNLED